MADDWNEWAIYVKQSIERLENKQTEIFTLLNKMAVDIAVLKTKASIAGAVWGSVMAFVTSMIVYLITKKG